MVDRRIHTIWEKTKLEMPIIRMGRRQVGDKPPDAIEAGFLVHVALGEVAD